MKNLKQTINNINEKIAVKATLIFGSMWATYLFFCYGFLPILFPQNMDKFLYWSNTVQLWSLPLLMVGQNVLSRVSEKRAQSDHEMIIAEFAEIKEMMSLLQEENQEIHMLINSISDLQIKLNNK